MRIVLINSEYPLPSGNGHGGIATYTYTSAEALAGKGHNVHVLARKGSNLGHLGPEIKTHYYDYSPPGGMERFTESFYDGNLKWEIGHSRHILSILLEIHSAEKIDIVEFPEFGGMAYACGSKVPFPFVVNFHTPSEIVNELNNTPITHKLRHMQWFEQKDLRYASAFRCPSNALKEEVSKRYSISPEKITVIRNPLSIKDFEHISKVKDRNDRLEILFAARLERRKGAEIMLKSIKRILKIDSRLNITFAGETEIGNAPGYRQSIERTLSDEERKRVWFLGSIDHNELPLLYRRSTFFLIPSLFENCPYSLLEAMAARLPVIGSDTGGIKEIINHKKNGLLFSPDNIESLLDCIKTLVEQPRFAEMLADQAYKDVELRFSPEVTVTQAVDFYRSVIDQAK